jgi:uncharacterized protein (TIGR02996 family)
VDAVSAAERADWSACLSALLARWRDAKVPPLAELIERISPVVAAPPCPPTAAGIAARVEAASDADIGPILETVLREVRRTPRLYRFVVELADRRAPDPRIAAALAALVARPPFARRDGGLYGDVIAALDRIDDPRFRDVITERWEALWPSASRLRKYRDDVLVLQRVAGSLLGRPVPTADAKLRAMIAAVEAARATAASRRHTDTRSAAELLDAIYDDPLDDALRLVYGDALQAAGDPRGELIALQCARGDAPPSRRERELLAAHDRAWLGPIEPIVRKQGLVYRRGFVACAREARERIDHRPLLAAREWRTVEELDVGEWGDDAVEFLAQPLPALRGVWGVRVVDLVGGLDRAGPVRWTRLGVRAGGGFEREVWRALLAGDALPDLTELDLTSWLPPWSLDDLADSPLGARLATLRLDASGSESYLAEKLAAAQRTGARAIELVPEYAFPATASGPLVRLRGTSLEVGGHGTRIDLRYAASLLERLTPGTITECTLALPAKARVTPDSQAPFARALAVHGLPALPSS